jgi:hypothetical protein
MVFAKLIMIWLLINALVVVLLVPATDSEREIEHRRRPV